MPRPATIGAVPDILSHSGKVAQQAAGREERKTDIIEKQQPGADQGNRQMEPDGQDYNYRDGEEDEKKPG